MSFTVLYHWRLVPGRADAFCEAWSAVTRRIHRFCGSYGARLHRSGDHAWSYARWPSAAAREDCARRSEMEEDASVAAMRACVAERFEEIVLDIVEDQLDEPRTVHAPLNLATERLRLRPLRIEDAFALHPALADAETMRFWSRAPHTSLEESLDTIRRNVGNQDAQAVAITAVGRPDDALGWVVLVDRRPATAELGVFLRPDGQRRGFAREAVRAVVAHGFGARGLRRIYADTDPDNVRSMRLLEALGFRLEGRLRGEWETHLGVRDSLLFGRLATDPEPG